MDELGIAIIGFAGTVFSTLSLAPQVARTWRTRSATDISAVWLSIALVSMLIWMVYGFLANAHAIVWANIPTFLQASTSFFVKLRPASVRSP